MKIGVMWQEVLTYLTLRRDGGDRLPPPGAQGSAVRSALGRQKASEKDADKGWREK